MKLTLINTKQEVTTVHSKNPSRLLRGLGNNIKSYTKAGSDYYFYFDPNAKDINPRASRMAGINLRGDVFVSLEPLNLPNSKGSSQTNFKGGLSDFSDRGNQIPSNYQENPYFDSKSGLKRKR